MIYESNSMKRSMTTRPSVPPAQLAETPVPPTSSSGVGTYGGLNTSKSTEWGVRGHVVKSAQMTSTCCELTVAVSFVATAALGLTSTAMNTDGPTHEDDSRLLKYVITHPLPLPNSIHILGFRVVSNLISCRSASQSKKVSSDGS